MKQVCHISYYIHISCSWHMHEGSGRGNGGEEGGAGLGPQVFGKGQKAFHLQMSLAASVK